jgi:hypothetical protein
MFRAIGVESVRCRYFLFSPFGGDFVQETERWFLGWLPVGAQYLVEARR